MYTNKKSINDRIVLKGMRRGMRPSNLQQQDQESVPNNKISSGDLEENTVKTYKGITIKNLKNRSRARQTNYKTTRKKETNTTKKRVSERDNNQSLIHKYIIRTPRFKKDDVAGNEKDCGTSTQMRTIREDM